MRAPAINRRRQELEKKERKRKKKIPNFSSSLGDPRLRSHAVGTVRTTPLASGLVDTLFEHGSNFRTRRFGPACSLLRDEALEPGVLRLELLNLRLQHVDSVCHFLGGLLEGLLALLLLDAESGTGGSVAATLVLFGCDTGRLICGWLVEGIDALQPTLLTKGVIETRSNGGDRGGDR